MGFRHVQRAARISEYGSCPPSLLEKPIVDELNKWIPRFVNEVRRQDGEYYPPRTIHQLLAGLQRHMLDMNYSVPKFLEMTQLIVTQSFMLMKFHLIILFFLLINTLLIT